MLKDLLTDILNIDDILIIVRSDGAVIEMRSNSLKISQKDKWITIGDNDGPCHMHIDSSMITKAKFLTEQKTDKIVYSIRFFDKQNVRQFSAVFAKMYDKELKLNIDRKMLYDKLFQKYGSFEIIEFPELH